MSMLPAVFGENLFDMFNDMDAFERQFFGRQARPEHVLYGKNAAHMMQTDVRETDEGYEVDVNLPGFAKDEISLELNNGYLTISTQKKLEKDQEKKGKVIRQERYAGTMQRSFYVGDHLTEEDIKAKYENGVLHLQVPKQVQKIPEKRVISIEG